MKIKWKQVCAICLAPLDPYYTGGTYREKHLFDQYLIKTNLPFHYNDTCGWKGTKVCKACYIHNGIRYNPRIDSLRQIGAIRNIRPKRESVDRPTTKQWRRDFYQILKDDRSLVF